MIIEPGVFSEDWGNTHTTYKAVAKYFPKTKLILDDGYAVFRLAERTENGVFVAEKEWTRKLEKQPFRGSMNLARAMGEKFEFANCLNWMPKLRQYILNPEYRLRHFCDLVEEVNEKGVGKSGIFVRPVSPMKEFSGQVFKRVAKLENEFHYCVNNRNLDRDLLCVVSDAKPLAHEYRCIFVNRKLVASTQYMDMNNDVMKTGNFSAPYQVLAFAKDVARESYFDNIFDFVLDISVDKKLDVKLVEVNAFNTSSFYWADLNIIYRAWAESLQPSFDVTDKEILQQGQ